MFVVVSLLKKKKEIGQTIRDLKKNNYFVEMKTATGDILLTWPRNQGCLHKRNNPNTDISLTRKVTLRRRKDGEEE